MAGSGNAASWNPHRDHGLKIRSGTQRKRLRMSKETPTKGQRPIRLQIMLSHHELVAIEDFRFDARIPTRAAAVRELIRRGLETPIGRMEPFAPLRRDRSKGRAAAEACLFDFSYTSLRSWSLRKPRRFRQAHSTRIIGRATGSSLGTMRQASR
jgi:hypothetical protein